MTVKKLMKGQTFAAGKKRMKYPAVVEVKVDEIRLDVRREGNDVLFQSWADKPLHNVAPMYGETFARAMTAFDLTRLDMGILVNDNFNDTYRYVRSSKGVPSDLLGVRVVFLLFDVPDHAALPFVERETQRRRIAGILRDYGLPVYTPEQRLVQSEAEVLPLYFEVRERGLEGLMLKSLDHIYEEGKRTYGWLKVKPENEADAKVVGVKEAVSEDGVPLGRVGSLQVECEDGSTASVAGIKHDIAKLWFTSPELIVGSWIVFEYMERDRQGGYRHPRFGRVREDKA